MSAAARMLRDGAVVDLSHGAGGKAMRELIETVFLAELSSPELATLADQAQLDLDPWMAPGARLAYTTDSYVVDPIVFPGGDIGTLAVTGTVNDLAVGGAQALALSAGFIIEEGLPVATLRQVVASMARTAREAGVRVVTGDTKVVARGQADGLYINTSGIGVVPPGVHIDAGRAEPGDAVLVNGFVGDHGAAIAVARGDLALEVTIASDCAPLNGLVDALLAACPGVRCLRDATRGGLATVLNEFAAASRVAIRVREAAIPVRDTVRGLSELLGLDPLYLANEGKLVAVVPAAHADQALAAMRAHPLGREAAIIGEVGSAPEGTVILHTGFGGERVMDMLIGDQLPRIC